MSHLKLFIPLFSLYSSCLPNKNKFLCIKICTKNFNIMPHLKSYSCFKYKGTESLLNHVSKVVQLTPKEDSCPILLHGLKEWPPLRYHKQSWDLADNTQVSWGSAREGLTPFCPLEDLTQLSSLVLSVPTLLAIVGCRLSGTLFFTLAPMSPFLPSTGPPQLPPRRKMAPWVCLSSLAPLLSAHFH